MLSAGRKLTGCAAVLCLPARPSRLGLHKRSRIRRSGHVSVANMAQRQPAGEGELPRAQAYYVNSAGMPRLFCPLLDARARALLPPAEEPSIAPIPSATTIIVGSPRPSPGWDAVDLRAAPLMNSLARSGTVDRGRAQRARYLGDDARTGRSRSVSRSRSRSPSPAASEPDDSWMSPRLREQLADHADRFGPYAWKHNAQLDGERLAAEFGLPRCDACFEPSWSRAPTNGENIAAELFLRRNANFALFLYEAKAVVDPESYEALVTLMAVSPPDNNHAGGKCVSLLASGLGPGTLPAAHLADIVLAVRHFHAVEAAKNYHRFLSFQISMWSYRKVTFGELAEKAEYFEKYDVRANDALRRLAVKVGNKHGDVDVDTKIDVNVLAAETGLETMSLLTLVILLAGIPGFVVIHPGLEALFSGSRPSWKIVSIPVGGICFGLARK